MHRDHHHEHHEDLRERRLHRRERRHRETRDDILVAAREVLLERGASDLSLREIARRADFSPGALYKYFDSKDEVIKALADRAMGALLQEFGKVPADLPPDERALQMGLAYLAFARDNAEDVAVIALHESTLHAMPLTDEHRLMEEAVTGVFRDGVAQGVFASTDEQDPEYMAYGAWALVQGLATFEQQQRPALAEKVRRKQRQLLQVYINGLKTDWSGAGDPTWRRRLTSRRTEREDRMPTDLRQDQARHPGHDVLRAVHGDARQHGREPGVAHDPARALGQHERAAVDRRCLRAGSGQPAAHRRHARRHLRPAQGVHDRRGTVHRRLGAVRPGAVHQRAHRGARAAGRGRRPDAAEHALDPHQHVPGRQGAGQGHRHVGRHLGPRSGDRSAHRRHHGRPARLAEHLLDQRADRL